MVTASLVDGSAVVCDFGIDFITECSGAVGLCDCALSFTHCAQI